MHQIDRFDRIDRIRLSGNWAKVAIYVFGDNKQLSKISEIANIKIGNDEMKRVNNALFMSYNRREPLLEPTI